MREHEEGSEINNMNETASVEEQASAGNSLGGYSQSSSKSSQEEKKQQKQKQKQKKLKHKQRKNASSSSSYPSIESRSYSKELLTKMLDESTKTGFTDTLSDFCDIDHHEVADCTSQQSNQIFYRSESCTEFRQQSLQRQRQCQRSTPVGSFVSSSRSDPFKNTRPHLIERFQRKKTHHVDDFVLNTDAVAQQKQFFRTSSDPQQYEYDHDYHYYYDDDGGGGSVVSDITGSTGDFLTSTSHFNTVLGDTKEAETPRVIHRQQKTKQKASITATIASTMDDLSKESRARKRGSVSKNVRFGSIQIRYYERILTHNPSTITGPSIGIGWEFTGSASHDVEEYERHRGPLSSSSQLVLDRQLREKILFDLGYTQNELAVAVRLNTKARNQRRQTVQNVSAQKIEETLEELGKGVKKLFALGKGKKKIKS